MREIIYDNYFWQNDLVRLRPWNFWYRCQNCSRVSGKGYGTSALKILLKYGFMERRLHKCSSTVLEGNEASIKMHKKLGYEHEGILKENIYLNGKYYDEVCFGLTIDKYLENILIES